VALAVGATLLPLAGASAAGPDRLSKEDRAAVTKAKAEGKKQVTVLIATKAGAGAQVANGIKALGGTVRYRLDEVKYIRADVPTAAVEKVQGLAGVQSAEVDALVPLPDVRPGPAGIAPIVPADPPNAATPRDNPYMAIEDLGIDTFLDAHPTWDGRDVTIGIVDTGISLDHPSLLTTSTGQRKVIDWVTGTDPLSDPDPTWINMAGQVSGSSFAHGGFTWTAPVAGAYRIGIFNESNPNFGGEFAIACQAGATPTVQGDLNRNGVCGDKFGLLWNTTTNQVWVDTDLDRSFADENAMTDYRVNFDSGWLGTDNPATPVAERVPFTVETNGKLKFVNLGIISGAHGSHVAGMAAGHALFGGEMDGSAPGARIVSSRACLFVAGCTNHALFEGMIYVAKQANVDIINMSIGGLPALNDGNNTRAVLYDNLIETYGVQMFLSAGNSGPGVNTIGDPAVASKAIALGAYVSRAGLQKNYGTDSPESDNLLYFTSRGPREDGGFKPQVVAPGHAISTTPMWQPGVGLPYAMPPGYSLFNGTSMAAPMSAGAGAVLVSAAQQSLVQHQPAQLRQAINTTARYLDPVRHQAYDQGNGIINVPAAWDALRTNIKTVDIQASVPVNTVLSGFLATPGRGTGIYDREGVTTGSAAYTRTYTVRRTSGGGGTKTYQLSWTGNDGTFSSQASIALPLNANVSLPVTVNPAVAGPHSAILNFDDASAAGVEFQTMNTVLVSDTFSAGSSYTVTKTGSIGRSSEAHHYFFTIPAGTPAFKVDFSGPSATPGTGQARFLRWNPWGLGIDANAVSNCYSPAAAAGCSTGDPNSRTVANPMPGVWEVSVDARRSSDAMEAPYTLTASILGASVTPNPDTIASATVGTPVARSYTATNLFGPFTGRMVGTSMGSARRGVESIAHHAVDTFHTTIPAGTATFRATIGSPSDPAADLDLFLYRCATEATPTSACTPSGSNADGDSEESVTVNNPAAGLWRVEVDGFNVPAVTTTYNYIDVFHTTAPQGTISVTDANALRPAGASWTVPGTVTANVVPGAGRVLYGNVQVRTDTNVLVGQNDVIVESVSGP
jgi:hypothetical protein